LFLYFYGFSGKYKSVFFYSHYGAVMSAYLTIVKIGLSMGYGMCFCPVSYLLLSKTAREVLLGQKWAQCIVLSTPSEILKIGEEFLKTKDFNYVKIANFYLDRLNSPLCAASKRTILINQWVTNYRLDKEYLKSLD
jgi:hypothetical protein